MIHRINNKCEFICENSYCTLSNNALGTKVTSKMHGYSWSFEDDVQILNKFIYKQNTKSARKI
jgi:hypothetical protein